MKNKIKHGTIIRCGNTEFTFMKKSESGNPLIAVNTKAMVIDTSSMDYWEKAVKLGTYKIINPELTLGMTLLAENGLHYKVVMNNKEYALLNLNTHEVAEVCESRIIKDIADGFLTIVED